MNKNTKPQRSKNMLKRHITKVKSTYAIIRYLGFPTNVRAIVIGVPEHINLGDSAIAVAQKQLLSKTKYSDRIRELSMREYLENRGVIRKILSPKDLIVGIGGGNMGNVWYSEEMLRRMFLEDFPKNSVIIFPQTLYYTTDMQGREEEGKSVEYYNHSRVHIIAREQVSYKKMQQIYPKAHVLLTPDIVLSTTMKDFGVHKSASRAGVLLCLRSDEEKAIDSEFEQQIRDLVEGYGKETIKTDMYAEGPVTKETRDKMLRIKMQQFADAELVITDRLHGMIFSALTGTPCVALGNVNHKIKGSFEWIANLEYIKYAESIEQVRLLIPALMDATEYTYDNSHLQKYYQEIIDLIMTI